MQKKKKLNSTFFFLQSNEVSGPEIRSSVWTTKFKRRVHHAKRIAVLKRPVFSDSTAPLIAINRPGPMWNEFRQNPVHWDLWTRKARFTNDKSKSSTPFE